MKRQKRKTPVKSKSAQSTNAPATPEIQGMTKRSLFARSRNGLIAAAGIALIGWYFVGDVTATVQEHDLSKIGNGIPAIVQVHDPSCPTCQSLMREARSAMAAFDKSELQYLVADLNTDDGAALASRHQVGKITLLMFDANGQKLNQLTGAQDSEMLEGAFRLHIKRSTATN